MSEQHPEIAELERSDEAIRDGIEEGDAKIPLWFNLTFAATIVFALIYAPYYVLSGWSQEGQWEEENAQLEARFAEVRKSLPTANPFKGDAAGIAKGKQTWSTICQACHLADGKGLVGPSLIDPYWKYGNDDESLYETVANGRPAGMPGWGPQLGSEKIWQVLAYMETLPKITTPGPGAPDYQPAAPAGSGP